jgi:3-oxoacyl-[acyl-carrier protein] reductase
VSASQPDQLINLHKSTATRNQQENPMTQASKPLAGKVALVTGGSRGIGAAIVRRLAADGADVAFSYAASADKADALVAEIERLGVRAAAFRADQADAQQVAKLVRDATARFGRLDILVNSAGLFVMGQPGDASADIAALDRQIAVNVAGVIAAVREAAKLLTDNGRIVTISSGAADHIPFAGASEYSATKGAVSSYTRGLARDFGPRGITVNAIQPGPIDTDMNPANGAFGDVQRGLTALGRYGKPEEIAAAVAFLASPEASFITGATLNVDGGVNA